MRTILLSCSLLLLSLCLYLPGMVTIPLIDRDEAHFTQATKQMLESNNWFQIRFQEKTRFQKPPGINWMQAVAVRAFSANDMNKLWPYRLPSLLGAILSILGTFWFARLFFRESVAWCGAAFLACTFLLLIEGHMAVIDASLLSSVVWMQGALWIIYTRARQGQPVSYWWAVLFWLSMSFGFLLKGVTPLVGVLTLVTLCLIDRNWRWLKQLHCWWGLLGFLVISFAWLYPVNVAEHSNYLLQMFHKDLLPKLVSGHESHGKPPLFHLFSLPITFWPSSLFLWCGAIVAYQKRQTVPVRFLLAWMLPTWVFFELMPTKLPQYVLPTFPALALLCADGLFTIKLKQYWPKTVTILHLLWFILSLGFISVLGGMVYFLLHALSNTHVIMMVVLLALCACATYMGIKRQASRVVAMVLALCILFSYWLFQMVLPNLTPLWLTSEIAKTTHQPVLAVGFEEPSLVFYLGTARVQFTTQESALVQMQDNAQQLTLADDTAYNWLKTKMSLAVVQRWQGFNYSRGKWLQLYLVRQAS